MSAFRRMLVRKLGPAAADRMLASLQQAASKGPPTTPASGPAQQQPAAADVARSPTDTNRGPRATEDDPTLAEAKPLFSTKTLARYLAVPEDTVLKWRSQGRLPAPDVRIGDRLIRWKYETIAALVDTGNLLN